MFMPGVWILWSKKKEKKNLIFQKENGNTFTLFIIFIVKSLQKGQNSTNILLWPPICRNKSAITPKWFNSLDTNSSIFSSKAAEFFKKCQFCFIGLVSWMDYENSEKSGNALSSKFSRGFLGDTIFLSKCLFTNIKATLVVFWGGNSTCTRFLSKTNTNSVVLFMQINFLQYLDS